VNIIKKLKYNLNKRHIVQIFNMTKSNCIISKNNSIWFSKNDKRLYESLFTEDTILVIDYTYFINCYKSLNKLNCHIVVTLPYRSMKFPEFKKRVEILYNYEDIPNLRKIYKENNIKINKIYIMGSPNFINATTHLAYKLYIGKLHNDILNMPNLLKQKIDFEVLQYWNFKIKRIMSHKSEHKLIKENIENYIYTRRVSCLLFNDINTKDINMIKNIH
jgi:dihydrofolate reductase